MNSISRREFLKDFAVALERSILKLDIESKKWKDAAQAKIVQGGDPTSDREMSLLVGQRKAVLTAILKVTKRALAIKSRGR